jgi:hypothetical protein
LKKKILITGGSGYIAQLIRNIYRDDFVTIWSRRAVTTNHNEIFHHSEDLKNVKWWQNPPIKDCFDVVFHLAEPVKTIISPSEIEAIINSHYQFLISAKKNSTICVYPLSAYMYDNKLSKSMQTYKSIKLGVYNKLQSQKQIKFPVIHPLIDGDRGISMLKKLEGHIPMVNIFAAFNAKIPILRVEDLKKEISQMSYASPKRYDIYSENIYIKDIFHSSSRFNIIFLSKIVYWLMSTVTSVYPFSLFISGRKINDSAY